MALKSNLHQEYPSKKGQKYKDTAILKVLLSTPPLGVTSKISTQMQEPTCTTFGCKAITVPIPGEAYKLQLSVT